MISPEGLGVTMPNSVAVISYPTIGRLIGERLVTVRYQSPALNAIGFRDLTVVSNNLGEPGRYLGEGIAKLINLFNPELIILGGRVSSAKHFILDPVRGTALKQSLTQLNRNVEFVISDLGTKSGALGVAMLAARDLFEVEHLNPTAFV